MGKPVSRRSKKLVFFDRDGVILKEVIRSDGTKGSIRLEKEFEYLADVKETFKFCKDSDFFTVLASNQPDISRKLVSSGFVKKINETKPPETRVYKKIFEVLSPKFFFLSKFFKKNLSPFGPYPKIFLYS